jgi:hypothetical protein
MAVLPVLVGKLERVGDLLRVTADLKPVEQVVAVERFDVEPRLRVVSRRRHQCVVALDLAADLDGHD